MAESWLKIDSAKVSKQNAFGERAAHGQHGGAREVQLSFAIAVDVACEAVIGQVGQGLGIQELRQQREVGIVESELRQRIQETARACDDAVASSVGEAARKDLERGLPVSGAVTKRCRKHRQLVLVGEQSRRRVLRVRALVGIHRANRSRSDRRRDRCLSLAAW